MRPKDDKGYLLPPPHERLKADADRLRMAGALALAGDSRSAVMSSSRKVGFIDKIIDHVVDGDAIPKRIYDKDPSDPDNHCMVDLWRLAEKAVRAKWSELGTPGRQVRR